MTAEIIDQTAMVSSAILGDLTVPTLGGKEGDFQLIHALCYAPASSSDIGPINAPAGWDVVGESTVTEGGVIVGRSALCAIAWSDALTPELVAHPTGATFGNCIFAARRYALRGARSIPSASQLEIAGPYIAAGGTTPVMSGATGRTFIQLCFGTSAAIQAAGPPAAYTAGPLATSFLSVWAQAVEFSKIATSNDNEPSHDPGFDTPSGLGEIGVYWVFALGVDPSVVGTAALPTARRLSLDCAESYRVYITGSDYASIIDEIGWSGIDWARVLDERSDATVIVPDALGGLQCITPLGSLRPWRFGLLIERNDQPVWRGPVVGIARRGTDLHVSAGDIMARFQKRLVARIDVPFSAVDAAVAFGVTLSLAMFDQDPWRFDPPVGQAGQPLTRALKALDMEISYDVLSDFADTAVDYFVLDGVLYVHHTDRGWVYNDQAGTPDAVLDGPYNENLELSYGLFTEHSWSTRPDWSINGMEQGNAFFVLGPDTGTEGARRFWVAQDGESQSFDGLLDHVDQNPLYRPEEGVIIPDETFQLRADSGLQLRKQAPAVLEGGALAMGAPVTIEHLRPGSLWNCDIYDAGYGQLLQVARLKRVAVSVRMTEQGMTETISPVLQPPGQDLF